MGCFGGLVDGAGHGRVAAKRMACLEIVNEVVPGVCCSDQLDPLTLAHEPSLRTAECIYR